MGSAFILPNDSGLAKLFSDQTISGIKTFHHPRGAGNPIVGTDLTTKDYVDNATSAPSGPAGGDLSGTYPNPTLSNAVVSGNKITANVVLQGHLANNIIGSNQIIDSTISGNKIQANSILQGHLAYDSVSGNVIQTNGILYGHLANNIIDNTKIINNSILNEDLRDSSISGNKIAANSLLNGHLAHSVISGNVIQSNSILNGHLADNSIDSPKIINNSILNEDLRDSSISGNKIAANSIAQGHILSGYVDLYTNQIISGGKVFHRPKAAGNPIDGTDLTTKNYVDNLSLPPTGPAGGDLSGTYPNPTLGNTVVSGNKIQSQSILNGHIAHSAISGNVIQANSILNGHLADNSINSSKIINNSILNEDLRDSSISGNKIAANSLLNGHLAYDSVSGNVIQTNGILYGHLANNIIDNTKIINNSILNEDLRDSSISGNKIQSQSILNGHIAHSAISGNVTQANSILLGHLNSDIVGTVKKLITQAGHGFSAEDCIYAGPAGWAKSKADASATAEVHGVVESVNGDEFTLVVHGKITLAGKTAGDTYYLSAATAGLLTNTAPTTVGYIRKPVLQAETATLGWVNIMLGVEISDDATPIVVGQSMAFSFMGF